MRFTQAIFILLSLLSMASCASGPVRAEQVSLAHIENLQGYNEFGGQLLPNGRVAIEQQGNGYLITLYDSWLVLYGKPTHNPHWYKSDDDAVKIRLVRRIDFREPVTAEDIRKVLEGGSSTQLENLPLAGTVSVEKQAEGYLLALDLRSVEMIKRNEAWLAAIELSQALLATRLRATPGDPAPAVLKGSVISIKVFTGW